MRHPIAFRILPLLLTASIFVSLVQAAYARKEYLKNDDIRIGVDLKSGGGIFYFGQSKHNRNLLNHKDKGRLIQQSYYGQEDGSRWVKQDWRWNPVQGGDYKDNGSKVLEWSNDGKTLYVKTTPRHWASGQLLSDVVMEETITLDGPIARLEFSCTYSGNTAHPVTHQELPAVFLDADLPLLRFYNGSAPWTGGELQTQKPGFPNEYFDLTESWAAYTNAKGWGVGIYVPGIRQITAYRYTGNGKAGSSGDACSYLAPIRSFAFSEPMTFTYTAYLTVGTLEEIRTRFQQLWHQVEATSGGYSLFPTTTLNPDQSP